MATRRTSTPVPEQSLPGVAPTAGAPIPQAQPVAIQPPAPAAEPQAPVAAPQAPAAEPQAAPQAPETTALATRPDAPLAVAETEMEAMLAEDAGQGSENIGIEDIDVPFLRLLQDNSPAVKAGSRNVDGAKAGLYMDGTSFSVLGDQILVIPCFYRRVAVEWKPDRGGYVATHPISYIKTSGAPQDARGNFTLPTGNYLADTREFFVMVMRGPEWVPMRIPLSGTASKTARQWVSMWLTYRKTLANGQTIQPAMYARIYVLTTRLATNKKGDQWYVPVVEAGDDINHPGLYKMAKAFGEFSANHEHAFGGFDLEGAEPGPIDGSDNGM